MHAGEATQPCPSGRCEESLVEVAGCGAGRNAELIAQAVAELAVDVQGLGEVVLGGERLHEVAVAALSQRG